MSKFQEINQNQNWKVEYFSGDGLKISAEELGYQDIKWRKGEEIEIIDYDSELGEFKEYYTINNIERDEDGSICARIHYSGSTLDK